MNHIVDMCPLTESENGLNLLREAGDEAVIWLESTADAALTQQILCLKSSYLIVSLHSIFIICDLLFGICVHFSIARPLPSLL